MAGQIINITHQIVKAIKKGTPVMMNKRTNVVNNST